MFPDFLNFEHPSILLFCLLTQIDIGFMAFEVASQELCRYAWNSSAGLIKVVSGECILIKLDTFCRRWECKPFWFETDDYTTLCVALHFWISISRGMRQSYAEYIFRPKFKTFIVIGIQNLWNKRMNDCILEHVWKWVDDEWNGDCRWRHFAGRRCVLSPLDVYCACINVSPAVIPKRSISRDMRQSYTEYIFRPKFKTFKVIFFQKLMKLTDERVYLRKCLKMSRWWYYNLFLLARVW